MRDKSQRWGNSLAVRIPKAFADQVGIREQDEMEIEVAEGTIRLRPRVREPKLDELLAAVTAENQHEETEFGRREGHEAW